MQETTAASAASIAAAYLGNPSTAVIADDLGKVIGAIYGAVMHAETAEPLPAQTQEPAEPPKPAVSVKKSVTPDYLISLEDGSKLKSLKRHLRTKHGMSPEQYRAKWGLPHDYPMVAPNYAAQRSALARKMGLGKRAPVKPAPAKKRGGGR